MSNASPRPRANSKAQPSAKVAPSDAPSDAVPITLDRGQQKQTTDADRAVGLRITALRKAKGLSQTALGQAIGVTFQQVQKYEKGQNRIGAGRLREIAELLEVPVAALFPEPQDAKGDQVLGALRTPGAGELLHAYAAIPDEDARRALLVIARKLAGVGAGA
jgi:transcriptional regulator with XRE-family HTH domain